MSKVVKKTTKTEIAKKPPVLDMRKLPTTVVGAPQAFFTEWKIVMSIRSGKDVTCEIVEKNPINPLRVISLPITELLKLNRAAGFVRGNEKEEKRSEIVDSAKAFFFNAKKDPEIVKEPKLLAQTAKTLCENLELTIQAGKTAGEDSFDKCAENLIKHVAPRANSYVEEMVEARLRGEAVNEEVLLMKKGIPKSLKAKFLTGHVAVPPAAKLGSVFFGKELSKFGRITLGEVLEMKDDAHLFIRPERSAEIRRLVDPEYIKKVLGEKPNPKAIENLMAFSFPFQPKVEPVRILERMEHLKERAAKLSVDQSPYPGLAKIFNAMVEETYFAPPARVEEVKAFWEKKAKEELVDPTVVSKGYRAQTIEALRKQKSVPIDLEESKEYSETVMLLRRPYASLYTIVTQATNAGVNVKVRTEFANYNPRSLSTAVKGAKKKKNPVVLIRALTAVSVSYMNRLKKAGVRTEIRQEISDYLQSFMDVRFQEMAAEIVFITLQHSAEEAVKELFLPDAEEEEEVLEPVERNVVGEEDDEGEEDPAREY